MAKEHNAGQASLQEAYALLGVASSEALAREFIEEDQELLKQGKWDYQNPKLKINAAKGKVEEAINAGVRFENKEEQNDLQDILWFWYHHATSQAIWHYKDQARAREFSQKALQYQIDENPNRITRLLYLLVRGEEKEAESWLQSITEDPDKSAAEQIMSAYAGYQARPGK